MKSVLIIFSIFFSIQSFAGQQSGTVSTLIVRASDGLVYFTVKGAPIANAPSCATHGYWMIKDENSNVGKQQYALILSAHATGKRINISGMNTCSRWGDGEDVNSIQYLNP
jgi:hypothetical protein